VSPFLSLFGLVSYFFLEVCGQVPWIDSSFPGVCADFLVPFLFLYRISTLNAPFCLICGLHRSVFLTLKTPTPSSPLQVGFLGPWRLPSHPDAVAAHFTPIRSGHLFSSRLTRRALVNRCFPLDTGLLWTSLASPFPPLTGPVVVLLVVVFEPKVQPLFPDFDLATDLSTANLQWFMLAEHFFRFL